MTLELVPLQDIDPLQLALHANHQEISHYLKNSFPYPYTLDNALSFITYSTQNHCLDYGIVYQGECIGCIGVQFEKDIFSRNVELGYWISPDCWGKGILSHAVELFCPFLFDNFHIHKIYAEVFVQNIASMRVLEKNGFIQEGYFKEHAYKDGQYHDIIRYSLLKE